jgi:prevent-host-death family protein
MWLQEDAVEIGVRALRDGLSRHLEVVKDGHTITVTERGRPIARLVPAGAPTALERLRAEGRVTPALGARGHLPATIQSSGPVSDLVADQRR